MDAWEAREDEGERLRYALEAAGVVVWEWDMASGRVSWHCGVAGLLSCPGGASEETFDAFCAMIHPEDRARVLAMLDRAVQSGEEFVGEFRIECEDGAMRCISSKGRVICRGDGRPARMIGISMDVTDRKHIEQNLREEQQRAARLEGIFQTVRTLQHEINNPLQVLCALLELLPLGLGELDDKSRHRLALLQEATGRIVQVVQGMGRLVYADDAETVSSPVGEMLRLPRPSCGAASS